MPNFDAIRDLTNVVGTTSRLIGWIVHFVLGSVVWGALFALFIDIFKGGYWLRGIEYGIILWLLMMIAFMPLAGNGFFASILGGPVIIATLVLHIIFGFVLGLFYGFFPNKSPATTA